MPTGGFTKGAKATEVPERVTLSTGSRLRPDDRTVLLASDAILVTKEYFSWPV